MNKTYFSFEPDIFDEEYLVCRLEEKVNDGLLNYSNHIQDNGFFEDTLKEVVEEYELVKATLLFNAEKEPTHYVDIKFELEEGYFPALDNQEDE